MNILLRKDEPFKMKPDETITQMYKRNSKIVNGLANQGKTYTSEEIINKSMRALKWMELRKTSFKVENLESIDGGIDRDSYGMWRWTTK